MILDGIDYGDGKVKASDDPCESCGGDGVDTCSNPDHGFIEAVPGDIGRLGCPVCRSWVAHKNPTLEKCDHCKKKRKEVWRKCRKA